MPKKIFTSVIALFLTLHCLSQINQTITYSATNKSLYEIFQDIETTHNVHFSYNNTLFDENQIRSISCTNIPLEQCICKLTDNKFNVKLIGNQIIITQKKDNQTTSTRKENGKQNIFIYDTIPIYDTVIQHVTIFDTITITDTLERIKTKTVTLQRYVMNFLHTKHNCWSIQGQTGMIISYPHFYQGDTYSTMLQDMHQSSIGFQFTFDANYTHKNLLIGCGLHYSDYRTANSYRTSNYTDDATMTYVDTTWYWKYNELYTYYKFNSSGDSVAIKVLDSTYTYKTEEHPKKIEHITTKISNISYQYFSIPIHVGLHWNISNTFSLQPCLSFNTHILRTCRGEIPNETKEQAIQIKDIIKPITYSITASCTILYSIEKQYSVSLRPFYNIAPSIFKKNKVHTQELLSNFGVAWGFVYTIPHAK